MEALAAPDQSWHQGCVSGQSGSPRSALVSEGEAPRAGVAGGFHSDRLRSCIQSPASHLRPSIGTGGSVSGAAVFSTWAQSLMAMTRLPFSFVAGAADGASVTHFAGRAYPLDYRSSQRLVTAPRRLPKARPLPKGRFVTISARAAVCAVLGLAPHF